MTTESTGRSGPLVERTPATRRSIIQMRYANKRVDNKFVDSVEAWNDLIQREITGANAPAVARETVYMDPTPVTKKRIKATICEIETTK